MNREPSRVRPVNEQPDLDFESLTPLGGGMARVRFRGRLLGRDVLWRATLETLAYRWQRLDARERRRGLRNTIHVHPPGTGAEVNAEILIDVPRIDHTTVIKVMIMMRQWKQLAPGHHEYGPTVDFDS